MSTLDLAVLYALATGLIFWWLLAEEYRKYQLDKVRQRLFTLRDELFEYARIHAIFDLEAYKLTRATLNGTIRYAHQISLLDFLVFRFVDRFLSSQSFAAEYVRHMRAALREAPSDVKTRIKQVHVQMHMELIGYFLKSSLLIGPVILFCMFTIKCFSAAVTVSKLIMDGRIARRLLAQLDATTNQIGIDLQTAELTPV